MEKLCNVCVRGVHFLLTALLKPALLLAILSWNQKHFEGCLPGLVRATWALLPGYGALLAHISWLLIRAGGLTIQAKPSAGTCQSGKWQLDLSHTWVGNLCLRQKGSVLSLPSSLSLEVSAAGGGHAIFGFSYFYSQLPLAWGGGNTKSIG